MTFDEPREGQINLRLEMERHRAERREVYRRACELLGLPLICFEPACRRAGRCTGVPSHKTWGLPPCLKHYRPEVRYLIYGPGGIAEELAKPDPDPAECVRMDVAPPTLIEFLYGNNPAALERLRRPKGVRGPGQWENDPEGFARYMAAGDWRNPEGVARRPPVSFWGRLVP